MDKKYSSPEEIASLLSRRQVLGRGMLLAGATLPLPLLSGCNSSSLATSTASILASGSIPPLRSTPDANGLHLPEGFSSRVIAEAGLPVGVTGFVTPPVFFPDGAHSFADPQVAGGWIHVVNSEVPLTGGALAFRFAPDGEITTAHRVLTNTDNNCAGGATPWGTWISCEEVDDGTSWETHPLGEGVFDGALYPKQLDNLGIFKHEAAAIDVENKHVYLTEDQPDGCFYRFVGTDPHNWASSRGDLSQGILQVASVLDGGKILSDTNSLDPRRLPQLELHWSNVPNPLGGAADPTRKQVPHATAFNGGEGCWFHKRHVYFTTKGDNRVWDYAIDDGSLNILYDDDHYSKPILTGVDNLIVDRERDHIIVAEDGGNLEAVVITPEFEIAPIVRLDEAGHSGSEVTGLAFNPDRTRFYFNSQRGGSLPIALPGAPGSGGGMVFEIRRDDGRPIFD